MVKLFLLLTLTQTADTLDLSNCSDRPHKRKEISAAVIQKYSSIILDCNGLNDLSKYDFQNVEYLKLSMNPLSTLDSQTPFSNLIHLDITDTNIYLFPKSLCAATKLKRIDSFGGSLSKASCLSEMESLEILNLDFIELDSAVDFSRSKLKNISVAFGKDTTVNLAILNQIGVLNQLTRLGMLDFNFRISQLADLNNKHQIEVLSVSLTNDDFFCEFIEEVSTWKELKTLKVTINNRTVPSCLGSLTNIKTLILRSKRGNGKIYIPLESLNLKNLESVYDFKNIKDFLTNKSSIAVIVESPFQLSDFERLGLETTVYSNPTYILESK